VGLVVAAVAAAAAAATVGLTEWQTRGEVKHASSPTTRPRPGLPPLRLDLGVRDDREAQALRHAQTLYADKKPRAAAAIFARYRSLPAQVGAAFSAWPNGTLDRLKELVAAHPSNSLAQLHLGLAYYWSGRDADAVAAWRRAARVDGDTPSAVTAGDLLHPAMAPGLPVFVPSFAEPPGLSRLSPADQLTTLARAARRPDAHAKLFYGAFLQRLGRPVSAERQFAAAAALAPRDADARVAAAVGRFTKDHPERAFSRLGPLTKVFPRAPTVRFHLGLMLLWMGRSQLREAERQFRLARAEAPDSSLGKEANRFLLRLERIGTK
jgi:tetratricopeptide (TPR) repeat protein